MFVTIAQMSSTRTRMTTTTTSLVTLNRRHTYSHFPGDACDDGFDRDLDGIPDKNDNCPDSDNADQLDADEDGVGDDCDPDADNDGIPNLEDNCPLIANPEQMDDYHDGTGDACFRNYDGDGVPDEFDTCPRNAKIDTTGEPNVFGSHPASRLSSHPSHRHGREHLGPGSI